jgi:hypothetical protein
VRLFHAFRNISLEDPIEESLYDTSKDYEIQKLIKLGSSKDCSCRMVDQNHECVIQVNRKIKESELLVRTLRQPD